MNGLYIRGVSMDHELKTVWLRAIGTPGEYIYERKLKKVREIDHPDFDGELCLQASGPGFFQKLLKLFPKKMTGKKPAVAVPFYHPDGMVGFDLSTREPLPHFQEITMALDLARRGFITAVADAYPFHFPADDPALGQEEFKCDYSRYGTFASWKIAGEKLMREYPGWTGIGKLVFDTELLLDALSEDARVDTARIGIAGHSLGGKMAFYTGCLDDRVKAILASDFGIGWDQTNWTDVWYWGDKVDSLKKAGLEHSQLLTLSGAKPFMLLAGLYDNEESGKIMRRAEGYGESPEKLVLLNHASGHRPSASALEEGYRFLERWI